MTGHNKKEGDDASSKTTSFQIGVEIFLPFLLAGLGMVLAGLLLDRVQHWNVFRDCEELFILVPALLGLKGNLEMTLASRLSTAANLGHLDTSSRAWEMARTNLALVQIQGVVVGGLAAVFALVMGWGPTLSFDFHHALLLTTSSVVTASLASFSLGVVMILVVIASRKLNVNPDNVATPVAASLGDLTTLAILSNTAHTLHTLGGTVQLAPGFLLPFGPKSVVPIFILSIYLFIIAPMCYKVAKNSTSTKEVLTSGWTPVLSAMVISSLGGKILNLTLAEFPDVAAYQPVINGVAGNLVSVQASRISTSLHQGCADADNERIVGKMLLMMVIPGHLIFNFAIALSDDSEGNSAEVRSSIFFLILYLAAAVFQVGVLLKVAKWLVHWLWSMKIDPDNAAIPYLTSLGDLLGGALLALAFNLYHSTLTSPSVEDITPV